MIVVAGIIGQGNFTKNKDQLWYPIFLKEGGEDGGGGQDEVSNKK